MIDGGATPSVAVFIRNCCPSRDLNAVAERHVGQIADSRHSFGDATALKRLLAESGFGHVNMQTVRQDVQFADGALFARLHAMAVIGMSEKGRAPS